MDRHAALLFSTFRNKLNTCSYTSRVCASWNFLPKFFKFIVCNPCQSSLFLTILVFLWFIIISLVFFYLSKLLFSGVLQFKDNSVRRLTDSKYRNCSLRSRREWWVPARTSVPNASAKSRPGREKNGEESISLAAEAARELAPSPKKVSPALPLPPATQATVIEHF